MKPARLARRPGPSALAVALALWAGGLPQVHAADLSWRATSVQGPRQPGLNTRLGVAMFSGGEPATYLRRVVPAAPPLDGRMQVDVESTYRFADGSTLVMSSHETIHLTPQNAHGADTWTGEGQVVGGSGRWAGATGRFSFRARMGLDASVDGALGDSFLTGQANVTLPSPAR